MKHGGIPTEDSYGPYMGQDGYCHLNESTIGLKIKNFVNVTSGGNKLFACTCFKCSGSDLTDSVDYSLQLFSASTSGISWHQYVVKEGGILGMVGIGKCIVQ